MSAIRPDRAAMSSGGYDDNGHWHWNDDEDERGLCSSGQPHDWQPGPERWDEGYPEHQDEGPVCTVCGITEAELEGQSDG